MPWGQRERRYWQDEESDFLERAARVEYVRASMPLDCATAIDTGGTVGACTAISFVLPLSLVYYPLCISSLLLLSLLVTHCMRAIASRSQHHLAITRYMRWAKAHVLVCCSATLLSLCVGAYAAYVLHLIRTKSTNAASNARSDESCVALLLAWFLAFECPCRIVQFVSMKRVVKLNQDQLTLGHARIPSSVSFTRAFFDNVIPVLVLVTTMFAIVSLVAFSSIERSSAPPVLTKVSSSVDTLHAVAALSASGSVYAVSASDSTSGHVKPEKIYSDLDCGDGMRPCNIKHISGPTLVGITSAGGVKPLEPQLQDGLSDNGINTSQALGTAKRILQFGSFLSFQPIVGLLSERRTQFNLLSTSGLSRFNTNSALLKDPLPVFLEQAVVAYALLWKENKSTTSKIVQPEPPGSGSLHNSTAKLIESAAVRHNLSQIDCWQLNRTYQSQECIFLSSTRDGATSLNLLHGAIDEGLRTDNLEIDRLHVLTKPAGENQPGSHTMSDLPRILVAHRSDGTVLQLRYMYTNNARDVVEAEVFKSGRRRSNMKDSNTRLTLEKQISSNAVDVVVKEQWIALLERSGKVYHGTGAANGGLRLQQSALSSLLVGGFYRLISPFCGQTMLHRRLRCWDQDNAGFDGLQVAPRKQVEQVHGDGTMSDKSALLGRASNGHLIVLRSSKNT